jgi:hypothetical protein
MREPKSRRLLALEDRFGQIRREEGEAQNPTDMLALLLESYRYLCIARDRPQRKNACTYGSPSSAVSQATDDNKSRWRGFVTVSFKSLGKLGPRVGIASGNLARDLRDPYLVGGLRFQLAGSGNLDRLRLQSIAIPNEGHGRYFRPPFRIPGASFLKASSYGGFAIADFIFHLSFPSEHRKGSGSLAGRQGCG